MCGNALIRNQPERAQDGDTSRAVDSDDRQRAADERRRRRDDRLDRAHDSVGDGTGARNLIATRL